jgi:hypothetical protein
VQGDAAGLDRIFTALTAAVALARTEGTERGIGPAFREVVRRAREMHDLLVEAIHSEPRVADFLRGYTDALDNALQQLEALAEMPDGKVQ